MSWNNLAAKHFDWVEQMGWHNKSVLEALALIASEIGETAYECITGAPSPLFGEELADITLRVIDLAKWQGIDLEALLAKPVEIQWYSPELPIRVLELMVDMGKWVNTSRKATLGDDFTEYLGVVLRRVQGLAETAQVDLLAEVSRKMAINAQRGTRGRPI